MIEFSYTERVDPRLFVGRRALVSELENRLSSTVFLGEARIGKSSLLRHLKYKLAKLDDRSRRQLPVHLNLRSPTLTSQAAVYRAIAAALLTDESIPRSIARKIKADEIISATALLALLERLAVESVRVLPVVLIDNLDHPQQFLSDRLEFYNGLRQVLDFSSDTTPLKIVASAAPNFLSLETSVVSKLAFRLRQVYLGAFTNSEVTELVGQSPVFAGDTDFEVILKYLIEQSGGHPCLLQELIVKTLERRLPNESVLHRLELEAREISERGGSFFQSYVKELSYEEILQLLPIAFGTPSEEWQMPHSSVKRFGSAGLIRETPDGGVDPSCALFFRWFMQNVGAVLPHLRHSERSIVSAEELLAWLHKTIPKALTGFRIRSERELNALVQGVLAGGGIGFEREAGIQFKTKKYRVDFAIPNLDVAVELKLAKDSGRLGHIIDEIEVDALAYLTTYRHLVAIIVGPDASTRLRDYAQQARNPFIHFVIVEA